MKLFQMRTFVCLLLIWSSAFSQSDLKSQLTRVEKGLLPPVPVKGDSTWSIEERMKFWKVPGVSVAVIKDFKIVWAKGYGVKDVESKEPVTADTLFQAASISKPVSAMTALKKVEEGKLALDENINNKLTSWKIPDNEFTAKKKVTLANLFSHTAGLTVHGFPGYHSAAKFPTVPQILDGTEPANTAPVRVDIEPGTKVRYSGGGTTVAQLALMDIEKKSFPQIADETVLKPLSMTNSTYQQPLPLKLAKKAASGHDFSGSVIPGKFHVYPEMAPAGLWTTPTDLAKFAIEMQLSLAGKSNKVLSKEMATKMVTPFLDPNSGIGFSIDTKANNVYFGHGGANNGFRCQLMVHRDKGYGAVVMINSDNGPILYEILRSIANEYQWGEYVPEPAEKLSLDTTTLDQYVGRYLMDVDRVFSITKTDSRLFSEAPHVPKTELSPLADGSFIRKLDGARITFKKSEEDKITALSLAMFGRNFDSIRLIDDKLLPSELILQGKITEAIEAYRKIKTEAPNNTIVQEGRFGNFGFYLLRTNKTAEAIAIYRLNTELYPQSSNAFTNLANAYIKSGNKSEAILNLKKALQINPKNWEATEYLHHLENQK